MQLSKDGKRCNTHTGQSEMEKQAFRHRMSLLPSNWICQSSIETHAVTNIIIILQSGKTGSAWQNNTALKLPRNQQTSVASFTYVAEGHRQVSSGDEREVFLASDWTKLICTSFNQNGFLWAKGLLPRPWWADSFHIKNSTSVTTLASVNTTAFDDVCILSIRAIVHLPINAPPGLWGECHKPIRQRA